MDQLSSPAPVAAAAPAGALALEVRGLTRRFGGLLAVNNVSLGVGEGEIFGLIGPNGAGKTTVFNLMTGLTPVTSGEVRLRGENITGLRPYQIAQRGMARTFQNIRLFGNLSALTNVEIGRHTHTGSGIVAGVLGLPRARAEERLTEARAMELLRLVGLADRAAEKARNFPYGDQRRLEIARALALQPKVLLLDEPAAGMNSGEKAELSDFIRRVKAEFDLTILLIEHNVPLVMGLCDRVAVLDFGHLLALGTPEAVQNDAKVIDAYLGAAE